MKTIAITWFGCFVGCFAVLGGLLPLWAPGGASEVPTSALTRLGGETAVDAGSTITYDVAACGTGPAYCYGCGGHGCYCNDREYFLKPSAPGYVWNNGSITNCSLFWQCSYPDCTGICMQKMGNCQKTYLAVSDP